MLLDILFREIRFKAVRSSGPGGQHVNKTSSKVEVNFDIDSSEALTYYEKIRLLKKLASRVSSGGTLMLSCGETRSQHRNKTIVIERLVALLEESLKVAKIRKKTKPSKNAIERRLKTKKGRALKKTNRKPPTID
ncbi:MAG: ribosome-associated protein [Sediminicola sp.]|jgi:ribosome-associated protein|tara:strand:+ start:241 stop:645 length:405 start_codon:yes stop_codon:yes gene_type:complete